MLIESMPFGWRQPTVGFWPRAGGLAVVVDAPRDPTGVVGLLGRHDLVVTALLVTHGHIDTSAAPGRWPIDRRRRMIHPDDDFLTLDRTDSCVACWG